MGIAPENERVPITFPRELAKKLRELAEADKRTLSMYLTVVLEKHVAETEKGVD